MVDKYKEEDDDNEHFLENDFSLIGMFDSSSVWVKTSVAVSLQTDSGFNSSDKGDVQRVSATDNRTFLMIESGVQPTGLPQSTAIGQGLHNKCLLCFHHVCYMRQKPRCR